MSKIVKITTLLFLAACGDDVDAVPDAPPTPTPDAPAPTPDAPVVDDCQPVALRTDLPWHGTNRQTLTTWIDSKGCDSPGYDENNKPLALFDWDNTVVKNDTGDAVTFYMIAQGKVLQPANRNWKLTSKYMTDEAAAALSTACDALAAPGQPIPTNTVAGQPCADQMLRMYVDNIAAPGSANAAFVGHDFRRMEPTYAWTPQLMAGYTPAQVSQFSLDATAPMLAAAIGTTQTIGTRAGLNGYLRIYDQIKDLIGAMQSRGFDVWIITASPQDVVAPLAAMVGVQPDRVIGLRLLKDSAGKLTYSFEGCGPIADGDDSLINYIEGKRCWVNKIIYGDTTANAINRRPAAMRTRQVFAAGDSDTDIEFMRDSQYKLAINRQRNELMCFAYHDEGDSWLVNPMFIAPRAKKTSPYPCATTACKDASGAGQPCKDDMNATIPDQEDLVFAQ